MIDHTGVAVRDYLESKAFYLLALAPLGYQLIMEVPKEMTGGIGVAGFGVPPKADFWLAGSGEPNNPRVHVAFRAATRAAVNAFVRDPDGHNIEAVCHD